MSSSVDLCVQGQELITPRTMFEYDNHTNIPWNDPEYQPVREYLDPARQMAERRYADSPKGQKDMRYLTRRGFYMDYHMKIMKEIPASSTYDFKSQFDQTQNKKESKKHKIDNKLMKYSYHDRIEMEEKNRKKPGPGAYNLNKTQDQLKEELKGYQRRKMKVGEKKYFYEDTEFLSNQTPGMGSYNPHDDVPNLKMNKTTHKFWIDKHKKDSARSMKKHRSVPGPSNYSPCPLEYNTFNRVAVSAPKRKKSLTKNGFGSDSRFPYTRENKKKILEVRPPPSAYNMMIEWKGKNMDIKKNNWIRTRSTGFSQSVYH